MHCFNCEKTGHLASKCRQPRKQRGTAKTVETKDETKEDTVESVEVEQDKHWICGVTESDMYNDFIDENKSSNVLSDNLI